MFSPDLWSARLAFSLLTSIALSIAGGCASLGPLSPLAPLERRLVFYPAKYPAGEWKPANLAFEDAYFTADDGTKLHGWFVDRPQARGVALFCHGNAGNITGLADSLRILSERHRLVVMTFDYRGYGRSEGKPSEAGILEDARAARRWLAQRTGVAERDIIMMGQSLGGAVAVDLAARDGARALILASTFTSLPDMGADYVPWLLPRWNMTMGLDSISKIRAYKGPVLISHGDADEVVPFAHGEKLYAAVPGRKQFFRETGGHHNDGRSEDYRVVFEQFLCALDKQPLMGLR